MVTKDVHFTDGMVPSTIKTRNSSVRLCGPKKQLEKYPRKNCPVYGSNPCEWNRQTGTRYGGWALAFGHFIAENFFTPGFLPVDVENNLNSTLTLFRQNHLTKNRPGPARHARLRDSHAAMLIPRPSMAHNRHLAERKLREQLANYDH